MNKFNLSIDTGIKENNEEFVLGKPPKFLNINTGAKSTNENFSNSEEFVLRNPLKFLSINTGANKNKNNYIPYDPLAKRKQKKKENQKTLDNFNKKLLKSKTCPSFKEKEILGQGGFGITAIVNGKVAKIMSNFLKQYVIEITPWKWDWIFNRYKNFCQDMHRYSREAIALFPNNFVEIKQNECGFCKNEETNEISLYLNMELIKGAIDGDFRKNLEEKYFSQEELNKLFAQVYYISIVTNKNKLHHNDLKPANIMIKRASKNIIYNNLVSNGKVLKLKISKGDYVPVFIDYDLVSFRRFKPFTEEAGFPATGSTSDDFSYFSDKTTDYDSKQKNNKILKLEEVATKFNIEETNKVFSELLPNGYVELSDFIGGKRRKSKKKVRKHQGINQLTGKLNKGYKYSGKLKSGLSKIVKVRKIKQRRK
jgi:hypothetical protein